MLQIDHVYEFLSLTLFKDFEVHHCKGGVVRNSNDITINDTQVFTPGNHTLTKIMFYDQEPLLESITDRYLDVFNFPAGVTPQEILDMMQANTMPYGYPIRSEEHRLNSSHRL